MASVCRRRSAGRCIQPRAALRRYRHVRIIVERAESGRSGVDGERHSRSSVGSTWEYASPIGSVDRYGRAFERRGEYKVVAFEPVTVPAGTFKCFRVEGVNHMVRAFSTGDADYKQTERWTITTWYCPESVHRERGVAKA